MTKLLIKQTNERGIIKYIVRFNGNETIFKTRKQARILYDRIIGEGSEQIILSENV